MSRSTKEPNLTDIFDFEEFDDRIVTAYNRGTGSDELPADIDVARSLVGPGTGAMRDFSYIAPEIPLFDAGNCVGCMECVVECPDTAILGKVVEPDTLEEHLNRIDDPQRREHFREQFDKTRKYYEVYERKEEGGGYFGIFIDPTKCKGCAECVAVCDDDALHMISKEDGTLENFQDMWDFYRELPDTPEKFIRERLLIDMMLDSRSLTYVGGAGSCMGCGEATALRMMCAATAFRHGPENFGIVASTGCNTVYCSTYPYNPFTVPWTNSLFENGPADAMGIRARWDQMGLKDKKLWVVGGDGAMNDIGFQSLSRMLASGMDINVLVLDTQVYSNTGGQASTASYLGQDTKMSQHGKSVPGKVEQRKELANICLMHPNTFVAQTTPAHANHFYKAVIGALEFDGPAVVNVYTTCQPEHGVGDDMAFHQAKLAAESRAFPIFIYDPRDGERIRDRLSLTGNPNKKGDWAIDPKTKEPVDFIDFCRTEGRFQKQFDDDGNPSDILLQARDDRLANWRRLQELAGII